MEIYKAISDFISPNDEGSSNILSFEKGDKFEVFDCHKSDTEWWGARALKTSEEGYVPSRYMQYEERKIRKLGEEALNSGEKDLLQKYPAAMEISLDNKKKETNFYEEPVPDYQEEEENTLLRRNNIMMTSDELNLANKLQEGEGEQIPPKKLVNPCLESQQRMALHKELKYQYKMGINVLAKPELTRVLTKRKEQQRIQEWDEQKKASTKRSSLEMKLELRANKLKEEEEKTMQPIAEDTETKPELLKVYAKITQKSESNGVK
ncbi:hypothetical protein ScPMuIL_007563 [Solemya velum]